jgi:O-antigen/teichoic acid export membrane protein
MNASNSSKQLYAHARRGWVWSGVEQLAERGLTMLVSLVLARLLEPAAFGLIASVAVFMHVAQQIIDGGIGQRVVQKTNLLDEDYSALFWCNGLIASGCTLLLILFSGTIAKFYGNPQLRQVVIALAGIIFLMSAGRVQNARLTRELRFKALSAIRIASVLAGCAAGLVLAFTGFGVWALLGQQAVMAAVRVLLFWVLVPWRPSVKPTLSSIRDLYGYGLPVVFSQVIRSVADQLINVLIARRISVTALGFFDRGRLIPQNLGASLATVFSRSNFPILAKLQDDEVSFRAAYLRFFGITMSVFFMLFTGLAVVANDLVLILLGEKWLPSVWFLQANCLAFSLYGVFALNAELLRSKGHTGSFFRCNSICAALQIAGVVAGIPWGARGMVTGDIVARLAACVPILFAVSRVSKVGLMCQLKALQRPLAGAVAVGAGLAAIRLTGLSLWPRFIVSGMTGAMILFVYGRIISCSKQCGSEAP